MEFLHSPAIEPLPAAASPSHKYSLRHQQTLNAMREEFQAQFQAKMERVTEWVAECAAARRQTKARAETTTTMTTTTTTTAAFVECDGDMEDLLLQVLIARPRYQGIPTVEEIQQFAGQLRAYNARLWTLGMTRGFFRAGYSTDCAAGGGVGRVDEDYPDDIDSLDSMSMREEDDGGEEREGANWVVHEQRVFVRKISPAEEDLRDEMIQEYRNIRRHSSVNDKETSTMKQRRQRSISGSKKEIFRNLDGFSHLVGSNKENQMPGIAC